MESTIILRRKISDEVADRLEAMICNGQFSAGDQIPSERDLMKMFGVGRPAIREGLFSLQKMGLLSVGSGSRARVTMPTAAKLVQSLSGAARLFLVQPNGVRHLQDARLLFEVALARQAASKATVDDIQKLEAALEENRRALDDPTFGRTDVAFHYVIAEIPKNPVFTAICEALVEWLVEQRRIALENPGANQKAYRAHQRIFKAISEKDSDGAAAAMRDHLDDVARLYWAVRNQHGKKQSLKRSSTRSRKRG
jgi:GntR family transcriptional regulator, sialic acid-inducible nan operon repressor